MTCAFATPALAQNPTALPAASRQTPDYNWYYTQAIRTAPHGTRYVDPASGVTIGKLTSDVLPTPGPGANSGAFVAYSEGGPHISRAWGTGTDVKHTLLVTVGGAPWLVDYKKGVGGGASGWRQFPASVGVNGPWLNYGFSNDPATPRIMYVVYNQKIRRFDTATMTEAPLPPLFPAGGVPVPGLSANDFPLWFQISAEDKTMVFMANKKAWVYRRGRSMLQKSFTRLDEPHIERGGDWVSILDFWGGSESTWTLWNVNDNSTRRISGVYSGHMAWAKGVFPWTDVNSSTSPQYLFNPSTCTKTGGTTTCPQAQTVPGYSDPLGMVASHKAGQWLQAATGGGQWMYYESYEAAVDAGNVAPTQWIQDGAGSVFRSGINWGPQYQKPTIGVGAVIQVDAGDPTLYRWTLTRVNTRGEVSSEGKYYYDPGTSPETAQIYVWAVGGGDPTGKLRLAAPTGVYMGIGVARLDGTANRLVAHSYQGSMTAGGYQQTTFPTVSPDGKLLIFNSDMGKKGGRIDVFVAELP